MTEKYMEDGETYTEEWKTEVCKHPVILDIFSHLLKTKNKLFLGIARDTCDTHVQIKLHRT